jgi:hypothetical protein
VECRATARLGELFTTLWRRLQLRAFDPFPACKWICTGPAPECRYRRAVDEFLVTDTSLRQFESAHAIDVSNGASLPRTYDHCSLMAKRLMQLPPSTAESTDSPLMRTMLCYAQLQLAETSVEEREKILRRVKEQATGGKHE